MSSPVTTWARALDITTDEARTLIDQDCVLIAVPQAWAADVAAATEDDPWLATVKPHHPLHIACTQALARPQ